MAGPGNETAGGRGYLRASHADREQAIEVLKAAFARGMLAKDEFDARVGQAFASRTCAELATVTADIPAGVSAAQPPRTPARAPNVAKAATSVGLALALLAAAMLIGGGIDTERLIGMAIFFLPACGLALGGLLMFHSWLEKEPRGQLPQGPACGTGGPASSRLPSADPGRQRPPAPGPQRTEAAPDRRPRSLLPGSRALRRWRPRGVRAGKRPAITHTV